ncbi:MAG: hypothetical protein AB1Z29_08025 [Desulfobacterales bacterium]
MKAVRMHEYGGPEVILCEEVPRPEPAAGLFLPSVSRRKVPASARAFGVRW